MIAQISTLVDLFGPPAVGVGVLALLSVVALIPLEARKRYRDYQATKPQRARL